MNTEPRLTKSRIDALLKLLQDDNLKVASLAMEQILKWDGYAREIIEQYGNSSNPRLRRRIDQLECVLARRRSRGYFLETIANEKVGMWEGVLEINKLHDPDFASSVAEEEISIICNNMTKTPPATADMAEFMRMQGFAVPDEDMLDTELYLPGCVVSFKYGAAVLLCVLTHHVGERLNWPSSVALHEGRFCLIDQSNLVIDPTDDWRVKQPNAGNALHKCGKKEIWLGILSQLFLVSMMEGNLHDLYNWGDILATLEGRSIDSFPYPLGWDTPDNSFHP